MNDVDEFLELTDWRRRVATMYARWRDESTDDPEQAAMLLRSARDDLFRSHPQSPLPLAERARFGGLSYFSYDHDYRMRVVVEPVADTNERSTVNRPPADVAAMGLLELPTSGDEPFSFRLIGHVRLIGPLAGMGLPLYWMEGYAGGLFLPFRDATSGSETYGAGRYLLDTIKGADMGGDPGRREVMLDFNLAYHPSCAYDPKWNCPLAPPDSRLDIPIRAGERL